MTTEINKYFALKIRKVYISKLVRCSVAGSQMGDYSLECIYLEIRTAAHNLQRKQLTRELRKRIRETRKKKIKAMIEMNKQYIR